jgi:Copper transport outer membrane protein, MctB
VINFRYHVVSLTAVFLALAIGLVVGTAALNGPAADALGEQVDALRKANTQLREQVGGLTDQANREEQFVTEAAPIMLGGKLTNRKVLIVSLPSGREQVDGIANKLTIAGATIAGTVSLQDKFFNPDESVALLGLASRSQPTSVPNSALPFNSDGVETSSALLATVLLGRSLPITVADMSQVLTAYSKAGYLTADNNLTPGADAVVFVSGLPPVDRQAGGKNAALVTTLVQFDKVAVAVVGGVLGGSGNLVAEVRDDAALAKSISTVDNASTAQGQVATALAIVEELVRNKVGHYGIGPKSGSLLPQDKK